MSPPFTLTSFTTTSPSAVMWKSVLGRKGRAPLGPQGSGGGGTFARGSTCSPGGTLQPAEQNRVRTADLQDNGLRHATHQTFLSVVQHSRTWSTEQ
eukprot:1141245-Pelagomonas_calceolata.AAC.11